MKYRLLYSGMVVLTCIFYQGACRQCESSSNSNVIILLIDTLRSDRLGISGDTQLLSPYLNRISEEGFSFETAIAPSSWTKPSVASLMTGLYPGRHGTVLSPIRDDVVGYEGTDFLDPQLTTLPEQLQEAGYQTAAFITNPHIISDYFFDQGFDEFIEPAGNAEQLLDKARAWIDGALEKGPFFLYLHILEPHAPYYPPPKYRNPNRAEDPGLQSPFIRYGDPHEIELWLEQFSKWQEDEHDTPFKFDYQKIIPGLKTIFNRPDLELKPEQVRSRLFLDYSGFDDPALIKRKDWLVSLYNGEVTYTDHAIASFIEGLRSAKILRHTVLVVTSDHGEAFLEHKTWGHGKSVYGEEVKIPLLFLVPYPKGVFKGVSRNKASLVDLYPTILDLLGYPVLERLDGRSLRSEIQGFQDVAPKRNSVFSEAILKRGDYIAAYGSGVKLIRTFNSDETVEWTFYNLAIDPLEMKPLKLEEGGNEALDLKRSIENLLENRKTEFNNTETKILHSEEKLEHMRALGYL